mmetsp:Transcript_6486/g.8151  ORF Transcript_6486/g.8151 Transcript_6486/m.8151 type:complete len:243 (+) Transcript_6486:75-803(+)|eukprot:CAMPEP_0172495544 /NCGR_PEP_ID=MMETSP1066-20121228/71462_1 /TAXON_ID=671091 /ORGANISM="Coscinodiscus wailesii, Strain CCMP2513" /LENGTH=242 /DNA_ID=CAMNT_0013267287 /DNA_START=44 /DNA_END=772 /DNA_ORIENTATION=+
MTDSHSPSASPYPAPSDDMFELNLMDIPDDIDTGDSVEFTSYEIEDVMADLDDVNPEELSTLLDQELDEDEVKFFESVESAEELQDQDDNNIELFEDSSVKRMEYDASNMPASKDVISPGGHANNATIRTQHTSTVVPTSSASVTGNLNPQQYSEALNSLASSMRRTELSRAELLRQRNNMTQYRQAHQQVGYQMAPASAQSSSMGSLAGLLTGKRTSLTVGLEQSRRQLRGYMTRMNYNAL